MIQLINDKKEYKEQSEKAIFCQQYLTQNRSV